MSTTRDVAIVSHPRTGIARAKSGPLRGLNRYVPA